MTDPQGNPINILLVEDDEAHAELVMRCLEEHRVANQVHHVADGESALDYLFQRGKYTDRDKYPRPHLALIDLRLPGIDGLEVIREIRNSDTLQTIPIVVLTTSDAPPDIDAAYRAHVNSYLVKPLDFDKFAKLLSDLGFYWLGWNQYPW